MFRQRQGGRHIRDATTYNFRGISVIWMWLPTTPVRSTLWWAWIRCEYVVAGTVTLKRTTRSPTVIQGCFRWRLTRLAATGDYSCMAVEVIGYVQVELEFAAAGKTYPAGLWYGSSNTRWPSARVVRKLKGPTNINSPSHDTPGGELAEAEATVVAKASLVERGEVYSHDATWRTPRKRAQGSQTTLGKEPRCCCFGRPF